MQMNVASCLNEYYVPYTYMMLKSLFLSNAASDITVYLLHDGLSDASVGNLTALVAEHSDADGGGKKQISFLRVKDFSMEPKIYEYGGWNELTMYRLLLWDILPEGVERVLHLDGDMIIHQDLWPLYSMDFEGKDLIACRDVLAASYRKEFCIDTHGEEFRDLFEEGRYFNAGMLIMNVAKNRGRGLLLAYEKKAKELDYVLPYPDQDLLNVIHQDGVTYADTFTYNFPAYDGGALNGGYDYDRADEEVAIFHYLDKKPWSEGDHPIYDLERFFWEMVPGTPYEKDLEENLLAVVLALPEYGDSPDDLSEKVAFTIQNLKERLPLYFRHYHIQIEDGEGGEYQSVGDLKNDIAHRKDYDRILFLWAGDEIGEDIEPVDFGKDYDMLKAVLLLEGPDIASRLFCTREALDAAGGFADWMCDEEYEFALRAADKEIPGVMIWADGAFRRPIFESTFAQYAYLLGRYKDFLKERGLFDEVLLQMYEEAKSVGAEELFDQELSAAALDMV